MNQINELLHPASFSKARRLGAKAAQSEYLWNWFHELSKRELAEIALYLASEKHIRWAENKLRMEGKI